MTQIEFEPKDQITSPPQNVGEIVAPSENPLTRSERRQKRWTRTKEWAKTVRNAAVLESLPHLAGAGTVLVDRFVFDKLGSTPEVGVTAIGINAAMWAIMYGPNTKKNVNLLEDTEQSIAFAAKAVHQWAENHKKDEGARRKLAARAHRLELTAWELLYGGEAAALAMSVDPNTALKYWGGAGALGLAKNAALWVGFDLREHRDRSKKAKVAAEQINLVEGEEVKIAQNKDRRNWRHKHPKIA